MTENRSEKNRVEKNQTEKNQTDKTWTGKNITILGLSRSGAAVARYVTRRGGSCFLSETLPATPGNEALRKEMDSLGVEFEMGGHSKKCFTHSELVVVSPGIPPSNPIMEQLRLSGLEVISEVELAYREIETFEKPLPIIAITGTNGKTTTTTLISSILTQAGHHAPTCGNIGRPLLSVLDEESNIDYLVAELSSFQLAYSSTFRAKIAVFTNFKPDHLDWHGSVDGYMRAKLNLFSGDHSPEWSVVLAGDPVCERVETYTRGKVLRFSREESAVVSYQMKAYLENTPEQRVVLKHPGSDATPLFSVKDLHLIGQHNYENVLASSAVASLLGVSHDIITEACLAFKGVEHRLEPVTSIRGISFYNDSKATNPDASISALRSFDEVKVVLVAGGRDKHGPLEDFVAEIKAHAAFVVLLGEAKERFAEALRQHDYTDFAFADSLENAVRVATEHSQGAPVLFSPACASFDMFKNFEERGKVFKDLVQALKTEMEQQSVIGT